MNITLFTTLGRITIQNIEIQCPKYTRYYMVHCIENYHYAVIHNLYSRKDVIYTLRKLGLSLLGNRWKDLRQYKTDTRQCLSYKDLFF